MNRILRHRVLGSSTKFSEAPAAYAKSKFCDSEEIDNFQNAHRVHHEHDNEPPWLATALCHSATPFQNTDQSTTNTTAGATSPAIMGRCADHH
jgi:hypothetical protein